MPTTITNKIVVADNRGRIALGTGAKGRTYLITTANDGEFTVTPMVVIPEREIWLWKNSDARASFDKGVQEVEAGLGVAMDFSQYLEDDAD